MHPTNYPASDTPDEWSPRLWGIHGESLKATLRQEMTRLLALQGQQLRWLDNQSGVTRDHALPKSYTMHPTNYTASDTPDEWSPRL